MITTLNWDARFLSLKSTSLALIHVGFLTHDWDIISRAVSLKENTYWIAKDEGDEFNQFILSF